MLQDGRLRIELPPDAIGWKFDDESHGLSHAMKAVDFIIKRDNVVWFIEIKDPNHPDVPQREQERFLHNLESDGLDIDLVRKYRDSWLYMWACKMVDESARSYYYVIITSDLDNAILTQRATSLRRLLPLDNPRGRWRRKFAVDCEVMNIESWNQRFTDYPITIQHTL